MPERDVIGRLTGFGDSRPFVYLPLLVNIGKGSRAPVGLMVDFQEEGECRVMCFKVPQGLLFALDCLLHHKRSPPVPRELVHASEPVWQFHCYTTFPI